MNIHTSLAKVDEIHHFSLPHFTRKEPIKKSLLEDLPSQRTTSQGPIIRPLHKPCLSHIVEFLSGQLDHFTCGQHHSQ